MKKMQVTTILLWLFLAGGYTYAQQNCKVLVPEIAVTYKGKCKKGLAHGKGKAVGTDVYEGQFRKGLPHGQGKYNWATGEFYLGQWKMGKRDGEGSYTFKFEGKDSIQAGIW